ncbi:GSCOCG00004676001-RA-CDS [Cotesia congregata]|nr:GSCOCG00004676001-RA-CDS [Cotesia congregata]
MGPPMIMCPMCCNETFDNLQSLREHLLSMTNNLYCPGCSQRYDTMDDLIQHLEKCTDDDSHQKSDDSMSIQTDCRNLKEDRNEILMDTNVEEINFLNPVNNQQMLISDARTLEVDENGDIKVVEPLDVAKKQLKLDNVQEADKDSPVISIPEDLNTQNNDENVLTMLPEDSVEFLDSDQSLLEIQHQDGELNDDEFMKVKQELCEVKIEKEEEIDSSTIYNCSSCGISFNSVIDHIKEYHEGQDVIVEVNGDGTTEEATESPPIKVEEKPQRVHPRQKMNILRSEPTVDSEGRAFVRNVVQIEDFWDKKVKPVNAKMIEKFFANPEAPKLPRKNEIPQRMYKCKQCLEQFSKLADFRNHACCNGSNQCDHCDQAFATVKALQLHMKVHGACLSPTKKNFVCRTCGTQFASHKSLRLHSRMHAPVKARPVDAPEGKPSTRFTCQECGKTLSESYRAAHMSLHAGDTVTCAVCNRKFDSADSLAMHAAVHPELGVQVPANQSEVSEQQSPLGEAATEDDLDQTKPYKCQHCGRRFTRPHEKVKHERIHTGEKPHVCEVCGKKFRVSYCLTLHMRTHTGVRPYECQHCHKRFKASSVYNHHLLTHGEERAYTCPHCPKNFKTRVQLAGHKNSHTKPFHCTECTRPFASLYAARAHIATHKKENNLKFTCHLCGASYGRAFALKDHLKTHKEETDEALPPEPAHEEEINQDFLLEEDEMIEEILDS